ncbi:MAG: type II secretion system F family protein [Nitrospirae bacterium]|nr:type II secretion system F family protein [Nitrospirota bacterium]
MTYYYEAIDRLGNIITGTLEAEEYSLAVSRLQDMNCYPVKISSKKEGLYFNSLLKSVYKSKVSQKDLLGLTHQLGVLLSAGFALDRSLNVISELSDKKQLRHVIESIHTNVRSGKSLSSAISMFPKIFSPLYINMVKAGEAGGFVEETILRLSEYLESSQALKNDIRSALVYPSLLSLVSGTIILILLVLVVPKFSVMFADVGSSLPFTTQILLLLSKVIIGYWWLILIALGGIIYVFINFINTDSGRLFIDGLRYKIPIYNKLYKELTAAQFCRTLGTLLKSGVPLLNAIQIVIGTINSNAMINMLLNVKESLRKGGTVSGVLKTNNLFPPFAVHMITVGEETANMQDMLIKTADRFDIETRVTIKKLLSLLEPMLILVMGLVVGFIVMSMMLAIFSLNDLKF